MLKAGKVTTVVIAVVIGLHAGAPHSFAHTPNVVIQWNQILQTLFGPAPGAQNRSLPMMHIAMFDAINSIEQVYTPYHIRVRGSHGGSAEVAAAVAARDVLTALYPAQQTTFDNALRAQLAGIPRGLADRARQLVTRSRRRSSNGGRKTAGRLRSFRILRTCCPRSRVCGNPRRPQTA